jgi:alkylation response protein AidB-like acyl-CoA dehydrogenase
MDFSTIDLDDDAIRFWHDVREFLDEAVTPEVRELGWADNSEHALEFHQRLGRKGWLTYAWPTGEGGSDLNGTRGTILGLELWRSGAPGLNRVSSVQIADSLRPWLTGEVRAQVLGEMASGDICLCQGITEPGCGSDAAAATTRAVRDGDHWIINGQKMFTTSAQSSRYCFLLTRTDPDVPKHKGLTVFLVPLDTPGIEITAVGTLGSERTNMVFYDDVRVHDRYRVGPVNEGWRVLNTQLDAEHGLTEGDLITAGYMYTEMLRDTFDATVDWSGEETPDGGRPIDSAATAASLARTLIDLEIARSTPEPMRRMVAAERLNVATHRLFDLAGPDAVVEHGPATAVADGLVERRVREAPATAIYGGTTDVFRNIIAEQDLGLPHHRSAQRAATRSTSR